MIRWQWSCNPWAVRKGLLQKYHCWASWQSTSTVSCNWLQPSRGQLSRCMAKSSRPDGLGSDQGMLSSERLPKRVVPFHSALSAVCSSPGEPQAVCQKCPLGRASGKWFMAAPGLLQTARLIRTLDCWACKMKNKYWIPYPWNILVIDHCYLKD